jgi:hypothetical protein
MMNRYLLPLFVLSLMLGLSLIPQAASGQGIGIGGSVIRNWQTEGTGFGARVAIPGRDRFTFVPQATWFPRFNILSEYFVGLSVHYDVLQRKKFTGYVMGSGHLNIWVSANESKFSKAKTMNASPEVGGGLLFGKGCWKPFLEHRYNPVWKEGSTHLGILWFPMCSFSGGKGNGAARFKGGSNGSKKSNNRCPAYQ